MFDIGDLLVYGSNGVYRVEDIAPIRHIRGYDPDKTYYKLTSIRRGECVYVPVDGKVFMRPVLACDEAEHLLAALDGIPAKVCQSRDPRVLREHYQQIIATHRCEELLGLIKSVNAKGRQCAQQGKRLGKTDQDFKKRAETLLCEELAAAMDLPFDEAQAALSSAIHRGAGA